MVKNKTASMNMIIATSLTMVAKIVAIVRQMVLTYCYGAGSISDAYLLAQSIPNTLFVLVSTAVGVSFIPVFSKALKEDGEGEVRHYVNNMISIVLLFSCFLVAIVMIFSRQIIFLFASGFNTETSELAAQFLRISIFGVFFIGMVGILGSYLKIKNDFFSPSIIGIALSVVEITSCIIASLTNDVVLAVGILIANFAQWLILAIASTKKGYCYKPYLNLHSKYIKMAILMSLPVMIGLGADEINVIIDRTMASTFGQGSISSLTYANTIVGIVHTVISVSVNSVVFVEVSKLASEDKRESVVAEVFSGINKLLILLVPITFGMIVYAEPIVRCLYERGGFTSEHTTIIAKILMCYALYIIPNGIRIVVQSYYYAYSKTKFCMYAGLIAVATNIIFNLILSKILGVNGLALATTLGICVSSAILFIDLARVNKEFPIKKVLLLFLKTSIGSIIMLPLSILVYRRLTQEIPEILALLTAVVVACIVYFSYALIFKILSISELYSFIKKVKKRGSKI